MSLKKYIYFIAIPATVLFWLTLIFRLPILQSMYYWFWDLTNKPLPLLIITLPLLIVILISYLIIHKGKYQKANLLLIFILACAIQFSFALTEGKGTDALKEKMLLSGHSEFARLAVSELSIMELLTNYETLQRNDKIGKFAKSKPPGTLLTYMTIQRLTNLINPVHGSSQKLERLASSMSIIFPIMAYIVLIPIFLIALKFSKEPNYSAMYLFITLPSITLITVNLDEALYPLLFTTVLLLALKSIEHCKKTGILLTGASVYIILFFGFSMIVVIPFIILIQLFELLKTPYKENLVSFIRNILIFAAGFLIVHLFMFFFLNYDFFIRYSNAINYHWNWKVWNPTTKQTLYFAFFDNFEFGIGYGITLFLVFIYFAFDKVLGTTRMIYHHIRSYLANRRNTTNPTQFRRNFKFRIDRVDFYFLSFTLTLILLGLLGKTKGETARLWLFLTPICCIFLAYYIQKCTNKENHLIISLILIMQFISNVLFKIYQDFHHFD